MKISRSQIITLVVIIVITIIRLFIGFSLSAFTFQIHRAVVPITMQLIQSGLISIFLWLIIRTKKDEKEIRKYQVLQWATVFSLLFIPIWLVNPILEQFISISHVLVFLFITRITQVKKEVPKSSSKVQSILKGFIPLPQPILISAILFIPWILFGALGSLVDTILSILFAITASQAIIKIYLFNLRRSDTSDKTYSSNNPVLLAGVLVIILGSISTSYHGMQILLLSVAFPWIAFISQYAKFKSENFQKRTNMMISSLAISLTGPLAFIDPDEMALVISYGSGELLSWTIKASILSLTIGLIGVIAIKGFALIFNRQVNRIFPIAASILLPAILIVTYFVIGQPGFYGEKLFVTFQNQYDLDKFQRTSYVDRREEVYIELTNFALEDQSTLAHHLTNLGIRFEQHYIMNSMVVEGGPLIRFILELLPKVASVTQNPTLRPIYSDLGSNPQNTISPGDVLWNLESTGVYQAWSDYGTRGDKIIIGLADSGVQWDHPELEDSYSGDYSDHNLSWLDPWNNSPVPQDLMGHGTLTLGVIVGNSIGVAPDANWISCVNLARNLGNPGDYLTCMEFLFAPYPKNGDPFRDGFPSLGAHIMNNSWGCIDIEGCNEETLHQAAKALKSAGVFMVVSAGNDGPSCNSIRFPLSIYEEVLTVGASTQDRGLFLLSSIGNSEEHVLIKPDLIAPGVDILSSSPGNGYELANGTSMAAPHVSGTVALMWSVNRDLIGDIDTTIEYLKQSSSPFTGNLPNCVEFRDLPNAGVGYGILNTYEAVKLAVDH